MPLALDRHRTRQACEAAFGCVIGRMTQIAENNTVDRADVENATATLLPHRSPGAL